MPCFQISLLNTENKSILFWPHFRSVVWFKIRFLWWKIWFLLICDRFLFDMIRHLCWRGFKMLGILRQRVAAKLNHALVICCFSKYWWFWLLRDTNGGCLSFAIFLWFRCTILFHFSDFFCHERILSKGLEQLRWGPILLPRPIR